jgi:GrpB-like predicted nucleotidyltransferase (UPF0157 family)
MDEIELIEYDPYWPTQFLEETAALTRALSRFSGLTIDHFGSTAVPGLAAKPIIDILVTVDSIRLWPGLIAPLQSMGYAYWDKNPKHDRLFFVKGLPPAPRRTHHIHVVKKDELQRSRLLFRDWLIAHPDDAGRYEALKRMLAMKFKDDREAYTRAKDAFVKEIVEKAGGRYMP